MTASEAFYAIESAAETVNPKQPGLITVARVANRYPEYELFNKLLLAGKIEPAEYACRCINLINQFAKSKINARLTSLFLEVESENSIGKE